MVFGVRRRNGPAGWSLARCLALCAICCRLSRVDATVDLNLFKVNTTIRARFATTRVTVHLNNTANCSQPTGFTFSLPKNARVTSLLMNMSDGCDLSSSVKSEASAQDLFQNAIAAGEAAALLQAWNNSNYGVSANLPPQGEAIINIEYGELLERRKGKIAFMLPLAPSLPAKKAEAHVAVIDTESGVKDMRFQQAVGVTSSITQNADGTVSSVSSVGQPTSGKMILEGSFDVGALPEDGLLMTDGDGCIVHLFNPPSLVQGGALRKNIVFVIDVSGSMGGPKLADTKVAFRSLLEMLTDEDALAIQTFSDKGTEAAFGPKISSKANLLEAARFVENLDTIGSTNLNDAYLDGISRAKEMQDLRGPGYVPIVVVMSDGQASAGVTGRVEIMQNVRRKNSDIKAKIYSLAFGRGADFPLLMGIALQNGGVAKMIYEGYGDAALQMQDFIEGEMSSVLLADIAVLFEGPAVETETKTKFPVLAGGSELSVRARVKTDRRLRNLGVVTFKAKTSGSAYSSGATASKTWTAELDLGASATPSLPRGDCTKSFAHAKIAELLSLKEAASALGDALAAEAATMLSGAQTSRRLSEASIPVRASAEAERLALEAQLVWPGLTAMIALQGPGCSAKSDNTTDTCPAEGDGTGQESNNNDNSNYMSSVSSAAAVSASLLPSRLGLLVAALCLAFWRCQI
eukprot:TRINITY_DN9468_c0_g1_i1.p1 TRINITY_DN9468_c0_g1~~TRINITY_DN9468_c0_g1_i1.p1  ORF type:complete len:690 (+),score=155.74 TRINITY_DN9468_c0_g1_i1:117-2186(+)